jgi:tetratricopeptide repeat protein
MSNLTLQQIVNLGITHATRGEWEQSIAAFRRALQLQPSVAELHFNLAGALQLSGRRDEAIGSYQNALSLRPDHADGWANLGNLYAELNRPTDAIAAFERAIALRPDFAMAHLNLGVAHLQIGNFERGWPEFEWRLRVTQMNLARNFPQPQWKGENLTGKAILLHGEGGFGDTLQFVRYTELVVPRGGIILLECQPALVPLLRGWPGVSAVIARGEPLPRFDFQIPLLSLPMIFKTELATIPAKVPYLFAPPERVEAWKRKLQHDSSFKVGLVWAGSGPGLSGTLAMFAPLANIPGVRFFSLQKGSASSQTPPAGMAWSDFTGDLHDFADTAALMECLDLVISIDTSVAHLAGAINKPVWVLLVPSLSDFRWLLGRSDSPWYPSARLFRQTLTGRWDDLMQSVAGELRRLVQEGRPT